MTREEVAAIWSNFPPPYDSGSLNSACIDAWLAKDYYERVSWWSLIEKVRAHAAFFQATRRVQRIAENRARLAVSRMFEMPLHRPTP